MARPQSWQAALLAICLLAGRAAGAQAEWQAQRRLFVPELDLEVFVSTGIRLSQAHTEMYSERLLMLARELFGAKAALAEEAKERPTYCVTIDHSGTFEFGTRARVQEARGKVFRDGQFVGGGEERRWIMPVRRDCTIQFGIFKRCGDSYISPLRFSFKEPPSWDEVLYGGVEVAAAVRAAGEAKLKCPIDREAALEKALMAVEPPRYSIKPEICRRLLDLRIVRLVDPMAAGTGHGKRATFCTAHVAVQNRTPWFIHGFRGWHFGKCPGSRAVYRVDLEFFGCIPPGKEQVISGKASEYVGTGAPPSCDLAEVRWSLKGQP